MAGMETVGLMLRLAREDRGMSLEDVARVTRVPMAVLGALEDGDRTGLPAPVYVRGFVRAFARAVGVDPEEAVRALPPLEEPRESAPSVPGFTLAGRGGQATPGGTVTVRPHLAFGPLVLLAIGLAMFLVAWALAGAPSRSGAATAGPERPAIQDRVDGVSAYTMDKDADR